MRIWQVFDRLTGAAMRKDGKNAKNTSGGKNDSHSSHSSQDPDRLLAPRGDYQTLLSFQKAEIIYDITFRFAHKFLAKGDRTVDQMIQSARSGSPTGIKPISRRRPMTSINRRPENPEAGHEPAAC